MSTETPKEIPKDSSIVAGNHLIRNHLNHLTRQPYVLMSGYISLKCSNPVQSSCFYFFNGSRLCFRQAFWNPSRINISGYSSVVKGMIHSHHQFKAWNSVTDKYMALILGYISCKSQQGEIHVINCENRTSEAWKIDNVCIHDTIGSLELKIHVIGSI